MHHSSRYVIQQLMKGRSIFSSFACVWSSKIETQLPNADNPNLIQHEDECSPSSFGYYLVALCMGSHMSNKCNENIVG